MTKCSEFGFSCDLEFGELCVLYFIFFRRAASCRVRIVPSLLDTYWLSSVRGPAHTQCVLLILCLLALVPHLLGQGLYPVAHTVVAWSSSM